MNIDNLKIVVIPTETDNYITQYSSVEVILSCEEKIIYFKERKTHRSLACGM